MFNFDKQFFEKHQERLLFIANKRYLRWLLGLNRLPKELNGRQIDVITPNSIGTILETRYTKRGKFKDNKIKQEFFALPRFSEALAYNLTPFVYFQNVRSELNIWRFSPAGLAMSLFLLFVPKVSFFGFIGTVTDYYAGAGDGSVAYQGAAAFATARDATTGTFVGVTDTACGLWTSKYTNNLYYLSRLFIPINTSGLTTSASISAAILYFAVEAATGGVNGNDNSTTLNVIQTSQASTSTLVDTDFNNVTLTSGGSVAMPTSTGTGKQITLDATGRSWISKTGTTMIGLATGLDISNTAPTGNNGNDIRTSEYTGTTSDPYLSITYTVSSSAIKSINGLAVASVKSYNGLATASVKSKNGLA